MIAVASRVGVPCIKYNLAILPVLRTKPTPGRGGASYSTWCLNEASNDLPLTPAGRITAEIFWERITYFLERMIPVASEYRIRMACHPHDPGVPPGGYRSVDRVLGTIEGLKRFVDMSPSPYHGLNLCVGTVAEMLQNPIEEISAILRYLGERDKLFNIHFRNIRGKRNSFQEVYPDEGDLDMFQVMRVLKDVGYKYLIMPDHMPRHPDDPNSRQAYAFAYGYIKGLLQAIESNA
jgi:mannonate dehydratase